MTTTLTPRDEAGDVVLDLGDIQGLVLRGYRLPVASYTFFKVEDAAAARNWVRNMVGHVTTAAPWESKPASTVNIAFSYTGLRALGLSEQSLASFPEPFREGMVTRAARLGDVGESAPDNWEDGFGTPDASDIHVLVMVGAADSDSLAERDRWLADRTEHRTERSGLRLVSRQEAASLESGRDHFGYADGFSQPAIEGMGPAPRTGQAAVDGEGGWRLVRPGEFVLGYPDEENIIPPAPLPKALTASGSYLVYRKLHQKVALFRQLLQAAAWQFPGGEELLAAKLVGRWRDGTPLILSPNQPDEQLAADFTRNNSFSYADDTDGSRCPVGAHIRRVNPRDAIPLQGELVNRHRMVRRGLPYGPALRPGTRDDGRDRGMAFMCFQADIKRQFEFVQSQWINDGDAFRLGTDKDMLIGDHEDGTGKMTVQGAPPYFVHPLSRVVTVRGGGYFFTPGIGGLRYLSSLSPS